MRRHGSLVAVLLTVLALIPALLMPPTPSAEAAPAPSFTVSGPSPYLAGQRLIFRGNLGVRGVRTIRIQFRGSEPGKRWVPLRGFSRRTRADGSFSFPHPAPSMFGLRYRVVSGRHVTPAVTFRARSQELLLRAPAVSSVGEPIRIAVDTTPSITGRTDLPPPPLPGRRLTLQQRVGTRWASLQTATTGPQGTSRFTVTPQTAGKTVYRVRQENWTATGDSVGWFPSFPTMVQVEAPGSAPDDQAARTTTTPTAQADQLGVELAATRQRTAAENFSWGTAWWHYMWEYGESLTSAAALGARRAGGWVEDSDGTGRIGQRNGAIGFSSNVYNGGNGPGGYGTTSMTMTRNGVQRGRWEGRLQVTSDQTARPDFRMRMELVPADPMAYRCGARNVTLADVAPHTSSVRIGVRSPTGRRWTRTVGGVAMNGAHHAYAVEITGKHLTWYLDGRVIGHTKTPAALPQVPMVPRVTMVGEGRTQRNRTRALVDWFRGYGLSGGRQATSGPAMTQSRFTPGC